MLSSSQVREVLLQIIGEEQAKEIDNRNLQAGTVLAEAKRRLSLSNLTRDQQLLLSEWGELFRTGYLAWGLNMHNPSPPFCHVTQRGEAALEAGSRDPSNPIGYMAHVRAKGTLSPVAESYLKEALQCFQIGAVKAAAVLIGGAAEKSALDLRDTMKQHDSTISQPLLEKLESGQIKSVLAALKTCLDQRQRQMPNLLAESYRAFWPAFTQCIRSARNEAGHPVSIEPITQESAHALLLIFPELVQLNTKLSEWLKENAV